MSDTNTARKPAEPQARILIASDISSDAALVRKLLAPEYEQLFVSTNPDTAVEDFESHEPNVLILAFNALEKSERHSLGLYRNSKKIHLLQHRTIVLCNKDEVSRAYHACRKEYFDDYILFWPMTSDAPRLLMSVYHALRNLAAVRADLPTTAQFAAQARNLAEMSNMMDRQMMHGNQRIDMANRAMVQAEQEIGAALDGFSNKLMQEKLNNADGIAHAAGLHKELQRLKHVEIGQSFRAAAESVQPIKRWAEELKTECAPHVETARALNAMAACVQQTILIVDDDDFERKLIITLLAAEKYRLIAASGGIEALHILQKTQPDLILMDIMMPDLDGIETTRRLKTMPQFANTPVIMVTGNSDGKAVRESMRAGASNFVVKPLDRDTLLNKVARALRSVAGG